MDNDERVIFFCPKCNKTFGKEHEGAVFCPSCRVWAQETEMDVDTWRKYNNVQKGKVKREWNRMAQVGKYEILPLVSIEETKVPNISPKQELLVLVPAKCPSCGTVISVDPNKDAAVCQHCSNAYVVEKAINYFNSMYVTSEAASGQNEPTPPVQKITTDDAESERIYKLASDKMYLSHYWDAACLYKSIKDYKDSADKYYDAMEKYNAEMKKKSSKPVSLSQVESLSKTTSPSNYGLRAASSHTHNAGVSQAPATDTSTKPKKKGGCLSLIIIFICGILCYRLASSFAASNSLNAPIFSSNESSNSSTTKISNPSAAWYKTDLKYAFDEIGESFGAIVSVELTDTTTTALFVRNEYKVTLTTAFKVRRWYRIVTQEWNTGEPERDTYPREYLAAVYEWSSSGKSSNAFWTTNGSGSRQSEDAGEYIPK